MEWWPRGTLCGRFALRDCRREIGDVVVCGLGRIEESEEERGGVGPSVRAVGWWASLGERGVSKVRLMVDRAMWWMPPRDWKVLMSMS